jgi:hypothetical protein
LNNKNKIQQNWSHIKNKSHNIHTLLRTKKLKKNAMQKKNLPWYNCEWIAKKRKEKRKKKFIKNVNLKKLRREKNKIEEDLHTYER